MNDYVYDEDLGMYYSDVDNKYISIDEYKMLGTTQCKCCGKTLLIDEICWGLKHE